MKLINRLINKSRVTLHRCPLNSKHIMLRKNVSVLLKLLLESYISLHYKVVRLVLKTLSNFYTVYQNKS